MYSLFEFLDAIEGEKVKKEQPKKVIFQEHSKTTFHPDLADWQSVEYMPGLQQCEVIGLIPADLLSPTEGKYSSLTPEKRQERVEIWSTYVRAISNAIPKVDIKTHWVNACERLSEARTSQTPIRLKISDCMSERFVEMEVIEYLSSEKRGDSND